MTQEDLYILRRKLQALLTNLFYRCLWILPVKKNKIVFTTFEGDGGYSCNPRYIAEELLRRVQDYEMVWLVNDMRKQFPAGIRKVKNTFWNRAYHLVTAGVWIDNSRKAYGTAKRKCQLYIQTWHAGLFFKPVGKYRGKLFPRIAYLVSEYDSKLADYVLSNSDWCTERYPDVLLYDGEIIKTGSPRCDVFFGGRREQKYKEIRERYSIPQEAKIVTFAPTFRGGSQKGKRQVFSETTTLDFDKLVTALHDRFGGEWYVLLRLHPQLAAKRNAMSVESEIKNIIDVSQADDMNELLAATDVFITDYSSAAFDALIIPIPVFLYCEDLQDYTKERGQFMWDISALPFPVAETNANLEETIRCFDSPNYNQEAIEFNDKNGVFEDGNASERAAELIRLK